MHATLRSWERHVVRSLTLVLTFSALLSISAVSAPADGAAVSAARPVADVTSGTAPLEVHFSIDDAIDPDPVASVSLDDPAPLSYLWLFGDGTRSGGADPVHTFERPGRYTVFLLSYDGATAALSDPIEIRVDAAPAGRLLYSEYADRGAPEPLDGSIVISGSPVYVFLDAPAGRVDAVEFVFGDPDSNPVFRTEQVPPYDLMGGQGGEANALDLADFGAGEVSLTAIVRSDTGEHRTTATFRIVELGPDPADPVVEPVVPDLSAPELREPDDPLVQLPSPPTEAAIDMVQVSVAPDRSDPVALDGQTFAEDQLVHVFAELDEPGIAYVEFYIDDPLAQQQPHRAEGLAPYDLVGGTAALATPLDLRTLGPGVHVVTVIVVFDDGASTGVIVSFEVTAVPTLEVVSSAT